MNCKALPSEHMVEIRERLKPFVHGGKFFSSDEITALIRCVNTAVALTEEVEEENRLLDRHLQAKTRPMVELVVINDNVVPFPGSRPRPRHPTGGGHAA